MDSDNSLLEDLQSVLIQPIQKDVDLSRLTRWRIGGIARLLVSPSTTEEVSHVLQVIKSHKLPYIVVGDTSNLLFDSSGFEGIIVRLGPDLSYVKVHDDSIHAGAGISVPLLATVAASFGLSGLEHTAGIPGTLGGLIAMNGGSQRKGIGDNIEWVRCIDTDSQIVTLSRSDCAFEYRASVFQRSDLVIVEAGLRLAAADKERVDAEMGRVLADRLNKFPSDLPNCGSTFVSDPQLYKTVGPPGRAIEAAGLKGVTRGGAEISDLHANFIVNRGGATSNDVLALIHEVRSRVMRGTGYALECEVRYVWPDGRVVPAHIAADAYAETANRIGR